jgi:hypothetical protein
MSIRDLRTPDPVCANLRDGLHQTYHRMRERSIRHMPVDLLQGWRASES